MKPRVSLSIIASAAVMLACAPLTYGATARRQAAAPASTSRERYPSESDGQVAPSSGDVGLTAPGVKDGRVKRQSRDDSGLIVK